MAKYWTWAEIKAKVQTDLDLQDETFITAAELMSYANEAIDEAEAEIHTLYEDYFLTSAPITLVDGTDAYDLPDNIYANKIRDIIYNNNGNIWPLKRLRDWKKIRAYTEDKQFTSGQVTHYFIKNDTPGTPQIVLDPPNKENGQFLEMWYLRNANRMELDADICDIPEFVSFVIEFTKYKCMQKEGHPDIAGKIADVEHQRELMNGVLAGMVSDADNEIEADYSHYKEHS